jgi:hypothetical protein
MRIRFPKSVTIAGSAVTGVKAVNYDQNDEYDRSPGDDQLSGDPVQIKKAGSGTIELLGGTIPSCYDQSIVVVHQEVVVTNGAETETDKTTTFTKCTINKGANVPSGSAGSKTVKFDFAEVTEA